MKQLFLCSPVGVRSEPSAMRPRPILPGGSWARKVAVLAAATAVTTLAADDASACGCFAPPVPTVGQDFAVNQRAEQIVFEVSEGSVSAHVRILYEGAPDQFAWLLPMPNVPEIELSEATLFTFLDQQTRPIINHSFEDLCPEQEYRCETHSSCDYYDYYDDDAPADDDAAGDDAADDDVAGDDTASAPPVTVLASARVGSYDTITFAAEEAELAIDWLNDNGFIVNETMSPYMQPYLDQDMVFVASKLVPGANLDELRPLRLTYQSEFPAIPLRLTAIAAEPHMAVTAYIYADTEFEPFTARMVEVPDEEISAYNRENYPMLLARLVDEQGGFAFVKEYVGRGPRFVDTSACCDPSALTPPVETPVTKTPVTETPSTPAPSNDAGASIADAGAPAQDSGSANEQPVESSPESVDSCGVGNDGLCQCPGSAFDATDCDADLVAGFAKAEELAQRYQVLTRLTTRISPEEMVEDPVFRRSDAAQGRSFRLQLDGTDYSLGSCEAQVEDPDALQMVTREQRCAATYCDFGECVVAGGRAGCRCDEGFVARMFTDTDGKPSITCVPEIPPVDFAAGGIELPSACADKSPQSGQCVDVGGFPTMKCDGQTGAFIPRGDEAAPGFPICMDVVHATGTPGAGNYTQQLKELSVCAPPPPVCSAKGWLVKRTVSKPGKDCGNGPDPSWLIEPPEPTCDYEDDEDNAIASGMEAEHMTPMDTTQPRPAGDTGSRSSSCSIAAPTRAVPKWALLASVLGLGLLGRRRR